MTLDIIFMIFIALAMLAGGIGGGFKEILKLGVFAVIFAAFKIPSLETAMQDLAGPRFYTTFYIIAFAVSYFVIYKLLFFALRDLIRDKEGVLGTTNRILGVAVGLVKGLFVVFVAIYIFDSLLNHNIFTELKPYTDDSLFYGTVKLLLDKTGLLFL